MTTRNLTSLFSPKAVALLGASNDPGSVGRVVAHNLTGSGFTGSIMLVNPHAREVCGVATFASVGELPMTPDLAVIATPPKAVPQLVAELGAVAAPVEDALMHDPEDRGYWAVTRHADIVAVSGDPLRVRQIVTNYLSNALKFTPEGGQIDVSARVNDGATWSASGAEPCMPCSGVTGCGDGRCMTRFSRRGSEMIEISSRSGGSPPVSPMSQRSPDSHPVWQSVASWPMS